MQGFGLAIALRSKLSWRIVDVSNTVGEFFCSQITQATVLLCLVLI